MKNIIIEKTTLSAQDAESLELLQRVHEKKGKQLRVDIEKGDLSEFDEIRELVGKNFENPQEKYNMYYKGIRRILMNYLPKGKSQKEGRRLIYDEKNIFLNQGKKKSDNNGIRKSDGRMTFQPVMNEMLDLIISWVSQSQDPIELYNMLWELNEKHGYGHEKYN